MKYRVLIIVAAALFAGSAPAGANLASSKHNLSVSGPGTIKATAETERCIFCHIPHNANPGVPLWNHTVTTAAYTMYTSDYLTRAGYATPSDVGQRSRLCLSCHDGTVAIGSVYTVRAVAQTSPLAMSGVDAFGKMPGTAAGYLGTDLRDDHPVSVKYDSGMTIVFGSGVRGMELKATAPSINPKPYTGVKLYGTATGTIKGYVECTSCHDPHNDANGKFLVVSNTNGALCTACHDKTGWSGSIHQTSEREILPSDEPPPIPGAKVAEAACAACHKSHSGAGTPYLSRKLEENTCYNGTSSSCHGGTLGAAKNIYTVFHLAKVHPVAAIGKHRNLDVLYPDDLGAANRHAECYDCHSPHQAKNMPKRVETGLWYPATVTSASNLVANSGPLTGATGVEPTTAPLWAARTYITLNAATKEYQICYKCHSGYAIQNTVTPLASWVGLSSPYIITDQAWEFSPGNKSAHPVEVDLSSQTGSYGTRSLTAAQLLPPWNASVGAQTMYCSDCHGADSENSSDPRGPHGSNSAFMLKGLNKYWPKDVGGSYYTLGGILTGLFCLNCHPLNSGGWKNNVHSQDPHRNKYQVGLSCVACHIETPHGSRVSRLIAYNSPVPPWGAPYGSQSKLRGFKKATTPTGYTEGNCYIPGSQRHNTSVTGAD